jgi:hypothetical protein
MKSTSKAGIHSELRRVSSTSRTGKPQSEAVNASGGSLGGDIVVGPDGRIQWRADFGGAPDYTMFVPARYLLADIQRGLGKG